MLGKKKEKTHRCVGHLVCAKGSNISQQIANMQRIVIQTAERGN